MKKCFFIATILFALCINAHAQKARIIVGVTGVAVGVGLFAGSMVSLKQQNGDRAAKMALGAFLVTPVSLAIPLVGARGRNRSNGWKRSQSCF